LIRLQKRAKITSRKLILLSPSPQVQAALKLMRLHQFFVMAPDFSTAQHIMENDHSEDSVLQQPNYYPWKASLFWRGELTAANADQVWETTAKHILARAKLSSEQLLIDLTGLQFIDSTGVGVMLRAKKNALQQGLKVIFTGIQPNVRNVLKLAKLEAFLLGESKKAAT
jgi:anti-anti-sigma factor